MPVNIEARRKRYKRQAVLGVVFSGVFSLAGAVFMLALCVLLDLPKWMDVLLIVLAVSCILPIGFSMVVLYQRLKEIEGGELDAAAEY